LQGAAAGYTESIAQGAVSLGPNTGTLGLPPFIQSLFSTRVDITGLNTLDLDLCDGEEFTLFYEDLPGASYEWRKDGDVLVNETAPNLLISQPPGATLPFSESYTLTVDLNDGSCPILGAANVTYNPLPVFNEASLNECTLNFDQSTSVFNLTDAVNQFLNSGELISDYQFTYYENAEDASNAVNPITNATAYTNLSSPQEIIVVGENLSTGCVNTTNLIIDIIDFQFIEGFELALCDDNKNGIRDFDLTSLESQENIQVDAFYLTENDALTETNPISNPSNFTIQNSFQQELFFRIENNTPCEDLGVLSLNVIELPEVINVVAYYCIEDFPNPIQINSGVASNALNSFEYLWLNSNETTETIAVNQPGQYEVAITNIETGCTNFKTVEVIESGLAEYELDIQEFEKDKNSITVLVSESSLGEYEFALNINGPYQDSNVFENLLPGIYDAFVRDKNGCGIVQKRFGILGIMEYFTPNGDGINDVWGFKGNFNNRQPLANVYIFDRYGKLLKSFVGLEKSWDGTFNNKPMPSQDYWYKIELPEGRILSGNFTLKR
jgi:gliding motility-associated-like protein